MPEILTAQHFKDARLDQLAKIGNVAQFVSFGPTLQQRYSRIQSLKSNYQFSGVTEAIGTLLNKSPEKRVNIRSFKPDDPQGQPFIYGIESVDVAERHVRQLTGSGLFVIVNETIDVRDGGVSGVAHADIMEFAPGATPRVVESGKIVSANRGIAEHLLESVYGFRPSLPKEPENLRVEFSIHPIRRGFAHEHTVIWEAEEAPISYAPTIPKWPNDFSQLIGDKAFGLLLSNAIGLPVPRTQVLSRDLPPFTFGDETGSDFKWMRTAPRTPEPGLFPTVRGWRDPFQLIASVPGGERIASVLVQEEVVAKFSGALITDRDEKPIIEGVIGFGDSFMLGHVGPTDLDPELLNRLETLHQKLIQCIGSMRAEWAFDGEKVWIMQLQQEAAISKGQIIFPGNHDSEVDFYVSSGLSGLRELVQLVEGKKMGIKIIGNVGMTSHIADVLRRHRIPSRIVSDRD